MSITVNRTASVIEVNRTATVLQLVTAGSQGPKGADSGISYASVAAMMAATPPSSGTRVDTRGCAANGDGGHGIWYYDDQSLATHNVGTVVRPNSIASDQRGRYIRICGFVFDPIWYGAIRGTDMANAAANTTAFNAALADAVAAGSGGTIYAEGQYTFTAGGLSPITCNVDMRYAELLYSDLTGVVAVQVGNPTYNGSNALTNRHIHFGAITNSGKTLGTGSWGTDTALKVTNTTDCVLGVKKVSYAGIGLWMSAKGTSSTVKMGTVDNRVDLPEFTTCCISQQNAPEDAWSWVNENRFWDGHFFIGSTECRGQTVTISGSPTGGTFTLTYSTQTTASLAYNAAASTVQAALNALSLITAVGGVTVTGSAGGPYAVTFLGSGTLSLMTGTSSLTGGTTPAVAVTYTAIPGTKYIYQTNNRAGGQAISHNRWFGANVEGGIVEWKIDSSGQENHFYDLRWESQHASPVNPVIWREDLSGSAIRNGLIYGFNVESVTYTETGNSRYNFVIGHDIIAFAGESTGNRALMELSTFQSGGSALRIMQAADVTGVGIVGPSGVLLSSNASDQNRWYVDLGPLYLRTKTATGAYGKFRVDLTDGKHWWGAGVAQDDGDVNLYRISAGVLGTDNTLQANTVDATAALVVGAAGSTIKQINRSFVSITNATIAANSFVDNDQTLSGVAQGDIFHITTQSRPAGGFTWEWFVVGADTWSIRLINLTSSPLTVNSITFWYVWIDLT